MKLKVTNAFFLFLLVILISACSSNEIHTISDKKIYDILSTNNNEVIKSLNLSDSDNIESFNNQRFYVPTFLCDDLGVLVGFNGTPFDSIDKVKNEDEHPIFIMPTNGTIISFDENINFRVGDDLIQFKQIFGEGNADKEWSLKGEKQYSVLTYDISNLKIIFTSLDGDDFEKYYVYISK